VIVVDPPRKGCDETLLATIIEMQPERVVYVSCDSATLARDLKYLCERGYELKQVCPVDMFPNTVSVETVAKLEKEERSQSAVKKILKSNFAIAIYALFTSLFFTFTVKSGSIIFWNGKMKGYYRYWSFPGVLCILLSGCS